MDDEFPLLQPSKRPIQRTVLKVAVFPAWPSGVGVLRANDVEEARVVQRSVVESYEDIPGPFTIHQMTNIVNSSGKAVIIRRQWVLCLFLRALVSFSGRAHWIALWTVSPPTADAIRHELLLGGEASAPDTRQIK